ncbi:Zinc knuckle CX2CX4HX4C [Trema orientale]|uniref:Zinc knuckle CX2CX4HX4C n=1 Tax=Trema orientale TaxID=63057 RepID=A0A2P5E9T3_TREOI|nr:Zinc knuckle CX2CX4HX4C [Trema orientale]
MDLDEIASLCEKLTLDEKDGLVVPMGREFYCSGKDRMELCLVGKILRNKLVNMDGIGEISNMNFNLVSFWVQFFNVPVVCLTEDCAKFWGSQIGIVEEAEVVRGNMRARIRIDVTMPFCRGICCSMDGIDGEVSLLLRYEFLPEFCYFCGIIGYRARECPKRDSEDDVGNLQRGDVYSNEFCSSNITEVQELEEEIELYGSRSGVIRDAKMIILPNEKEAMEARTNSLVVVDSQSNDSVMESVTINAGKGKEKDRSPCSSRKKISFKKTSANKNGEIVGKMRSGSGVKQKIFDQEVEVDDSVQKLKTPRLKMTSNVDDFVAGLGNPETITALRSVVRKVSPGLVFLSEIKLFGNRVASMRYHIGFSNYFMVDCMGRSGGRLLCWNDDWDVTIRSFSKGHIDSSVISSDRLKWRFTGFYGHSKFRLALADCELPDLGYLGPMITWNNKRDGEANV